MKWLQDIILLIFAMLVMGLWLSWEAKSQPRTQPRPSQQERYDLYDNRGRSQGYVKPSPYSGRCCNTYDSQGRQTGVVRPR